MNKLNIKKLNFKKLNGLIPAVIQDAQTKSVLMLGFMNKEAIKQTIKNKKVTFWSRTKRRLWKKGETSGNILKVISIKVDCDNDSLLIKVKPQGSTCHTGAYSCFNTKKSNGSLEFLQQLYNLISKRKKKLPNNSYTTFLFKKGLVKILSKIKEESNEVIIAAKKESRTRLIEESADLLYHLLVLLVKKNVSLKDILRELKSRNK